MEFFTDTKVTVQRWIKNSSRFGDGIPDDADLLIKNGTVVTATDTYEADVYVVGEKVHTIGKDLESHAPIEDDRRQGLLLFPGGIDAHTHMGFRSWELSRATISRRGTLAGLHGGTTTIIDFAIQTQGDTLEAALNKWHEKAGGKAVGDYAFHVAVTDFNEKTRKPRSKTSSKSRA